MSFGSQAWSASRSSTFGPSEARFGIFRVALMWFVAVFVAAFGGLVIVSSILSGHPSPGAIATGTIALASGPFMGWMAWRLRMPGRPTLQMDARGLRHSLVGEVDWEDVVGIDLYQRPAQGKPWMLHLAAGRVEAVRQQGWSRWLMPMRRGVLEFGLVGLGREPAEIHAAALALRDRIQPPRNPEWTRGTSLVQLRAMRLMREATELMEADLAAGPTPQSIEAITPKLKESAEASEAWAAEMKETARRNSQLVWLFCLGLGLALAWLAWIAWRIAN